MITASESNLEDLVTLHPNPASSHVTISLNRLNMRIVVFDVRGVQMHVQQMEHEGETTLNLADWPKGIYLVHAEHEDKKIIRRLAVF